MNFSKISKCQILWKIHSAAFELSQAHRETRRNGRWVFVPFGSKCVQSTVYSCCSGQQQQQWQQQQQQQQHCYAAMTWLRRSVAVLLQRRQWFDPRSVRVGFVVDTVAPGHAHILWLCLVDFIPRTVHTHTLPPTLYNLSNWLRCYVIINTGMNLTRRRQCTQRNEIHQCEGDTCQIRAHAMIITQRKVVTNFKIRSTYL